MRRCEFITLLGLRSSRVAARGTRAAGGDAGDRASQQLVTPARRVAAPAFVRQGLREAGYVEGRNAVSECRGAEDSYDQLPKLATDLLGRQPAVLVAVFP